MPGEREKLPAYGRPSVNPPATYDVVIAGAGIIGSSIAWRLAQAGLRVALLDAGRMGSEASWAGAGMLAPGGEFEEDSRWATFALENLRGYTDFVAELTAETGETIDFQRLGGIEIAFSEDDWRVVEARAGEQARLGIAVSRMSPDELLQEVPLIAPHAAGAWFYPEYGLVSPRDIMRALRTACVARGVAIGEGVPVQKMLPQSRGVEIITAEGTISAGWAVLAAGAWSSGIRVAGCSPPRAFPVRGHLIGVHLEPGSVGPILRDEHSYIVQRADGFTIAGTSLEQCGFDRAIDPAIVDGIRQRAARLLPRLAECHFEESWLGFRPGVESDGPVIGPAGGTALWLAYGHYRDGILMAPGTASGVARGITSSSGTDSYGPTGMR
jgi:glycine oxidase